MYSQRTDGFEVSVQPVHLPEQSEPQHGRWVWAYRVIVRNTGEVPARLVARHWSITDANGRTETVDGPGVVGQTPLIAPGSAYEYHSGCPLPTPSGTMVGHYVMEREDGTRFEIAIPHFSLDAPEVPRTLN